LVQSHCAPARFGVKPWLQLWWCVWGYVWLWLGSGWFRLQVLGGRGGKGDGGRLHSLVHGVVVVHCPLEQGVPARHVGWFGGNVRGSVLRALGARQHLGHGGVEAARVPLPVYVGNGRVRRRHKVQRVPHGCAPQRGVNGPAGALCHPWFVYVNGNGGATATERLTVCTYGVVVLVLRRCATVLRYRGRAPSVVCRHDQRLLQRRGAFHGGVGPLGVTVRLRGIVDVGAAQGGRRFHL